MFFSNSGATGSTGAPSSAGGAAGVVGSLSRAPPSIWGNYSPTKEQLQMHNLVVENFLEGGALFMEAPTGSGKTTAVGAAIQTLARACAEQKPHPTEFQVLYLVHFHFQAEQVVNELAALGVRAVAVGGRRKLCQVPSVAAGGWEQQSKMCQEARGSGLCVRLKDFDGHQVRPFADRSGVTLRDIEDLAKSLSAPRPAASSSSSSSSNSANSGCPYYLAKHCASLCSPTGGGGRTSSAASGTPPGAVVVVAPYQMAASFDRAAVKLIVVDEAHNLPSALSNKREKAPPPPDRPDILQELAAPSSEKYATRYEDKATGGVYVAHRGQLVFHQPERFREVLLQFLDKGKAVSLMSATLFDHRKTELAAINWLPESARHPVKLARITIPPRVRCIICSQLFEEGTQPTETAEIVAKQIVFRGTEARETVVLSTAKILGVVVNCGEKFEGVRIMVAAPSYQKLYQLRDSLSSELRDRFFWEEKVGEDEEKAMERSLALSSSSKHIGCVSGGTLAEGANIGAGLHRPRVIVMVGQPWPVPLAVGGLEDGRDGGAEGADLSWRMLAGVRQTLGRTTRRKNDRALAIMCDARWGVDAQLLPERERSPGMGIDVAIYASDLMKICEQWMGANYEKRGGFGR